MSIRVVYIDDEVDTEKEKTKIEWLHDHGVDVVPVKTVGDAMATLRQAGRVDAVLLDVLMPPYDVYTLDETTDGTNTGIRLLQDIRSEFPSVPVVMISVKPPVELQAQISDLVVHGYLYKPVLGADILEEIRRVVDLRRG